MYKFAICDDELDCAKGIANILERQFKKKTFDAKIDIVTDKQEQIYELIKNNEIDVLILDVIFNNGYINGLDFAKELRKINKNFYLIFLTADLRYMHLSFVCKTFDFLVKPINLNLIDSFVDRLIDEFTIKNNKYFVLNSKLTINVDTIVYIEKIKNKSYIYTLSDMHTCTITLDKLLDSLPNNFIKCHRSYIVNKQLISAIHKTKNMIIFENGLSCPTNSYFKLEEIE